MRTATTLISLAAIPLFSLSSLWACPDIDKAAKKYLNDNFGGDEENPLRIEHRVTRINPLVSAIEFSAPEDPEDKEAKRQVFTSFFAGKGQCEFVQQSDGTIAEILDSGSTKFVFIRVESEEGDQQQIDDQVLTVTAAGEVTPTRDQHGSEIFFSQVIQKRCNGKVGDATFWTRDQANNRLIVVRQRHTDRDGKCRVTEDTSSYRYYRLAAERWELDDAEDNEETAVSEGDAPPAETHPVAKMPRANRRH